MIKRSLALAALGGLIALPACTSGQVSPPPFTQVSPATNSKLQFQVGTANLNGTPGLNTVVTFRQTNGFSAVLTSTPAITLPFVNTASVAAAGQDSGTNQISGSVQVPVLQTPRPSTFGQTVGAFAYGFLAVNSVTTGANNSVFYPAANRNPYYGATRRAYYVGPGNSFISNFKDGSFPADFMGYPSGFTTYALAPQTGAYSLTVGLNSSDATLPSFTATTSMASTALLPVMPVPVYTSDGAGGGTVAVTVPPGLFETLVFINDIDAATTTRPNGEWYTLVIRGAGPQVATLPANLGFTNTTPPASVPVGHRVRVIAVGFDYPAIEAVPVGANPPQAPVISNSGVPCSGSGTSYTCTGQADVTISNQSPPLVTE